MKRNILLLLVALLPMVANAYNAEINGIYYNLYDGPKATVTYKNINYNSYSGTVVIPRSVTYNGTTYSVTSIGNSAFKDCRSLTSVTIPNSVTSIGSSAFYGCRSLTSVTIPESVTSIGSDAFKDCRSLTSVTIPNSVTSIGSNAFGYCSGLTSVTLESNTIVSAARSSSSSMASIFGNQVEEYIIGNNVTSIGSYAFYGCSSLPSITIPEGVTSIGSYAFEYCSGLTSITIPNSVTSIGSSAFYGCSSLTSVTIPEGVTAISDGTFSGCSNLTSITIPEGVTSIGNSAFKDCRSLTSVTIPNSVTSIGSNAFSGCSNLTSITIPKGVTSIGSYAFEYCSGLTSITIPESVTSIGSSAFYGCSSLTSVTLESNTIVSATRSNSSSMASIFGNQVEEYIIGNNVTSIGSYAFSGCSRVTSFTIPSGITSIGEYAFNDCTNLKKTIWLTNTPPSGYTYAGGTINYVSNDQYTSLSNKIVYPFLSSMFEVDGVCYVPVNPSERTCDVIDCRYNNTVANMNIASAVSYKGITLQVKKVQPYFCYNNQYIQTLTYNNEGLISDSTFYGCTNLKSLTLGKEVSSIGNSSFQYCSSLPSVVIPDSVSVLGEYAFSGCSSLANVTLGNHVETLGRYVFRGCNSLPAISIPASVNSIGIYAFTGCTKLKTLIIADRENELSLGSNGSSSLFSDCPLDSVYIGGNITYSTSSNSGYSPFYRNTSLRTVVITDKETEISPNEFYGCTNLQNFTIGDGVTSFGDWAFSGCSSLKNLSFGSHLASIGKEAFSDCNSVTQIVSKAATPPSCGTQALDDINKWNCTLFVPEGSLASYQSAAQWKEFFFINEGSGEEPVIPEPEKCAKPTISYADGKLTYTCETEGVLFTSSIKDEDIKSYNTDAIDLSVTYTISVYASKPGFEDSDVAIGTLCWIDQQPNTEGIVAEDAVTEVKALPVLIQTQGGTITVQGAAEGTEVSVYSINGMLLDTVISGQGSTTLRTSLTSGSTAIVKIGQKAIKVLIK